MIWAIIMAVVVVLDQATKIWIYNWIGPGSEEWVAHRVQQPIVEIIPGFFRFDYLENTGIAFGLGSDNKPAFVIFMIVSTAAIVALTVYLYRAKPQSRWACTAIAFIVGGGIGNMIDRTFRGFVVDFIDFYGIWGYHFNVADSFVCIGGGMLFVWCVLELIREGKKTGKKSEGAV